MSKLFYDHLILIGEVHNSISILELQDEEKIELRETIEEIVHTKVLEKILDLLPETHHEEFLGRFHQAPFEIGHIHYLQERCEKDIHSELVLLGSQLLKELMNDIRTIPHSSSEG